MTRIGILTGLAAEARIAERAARRSGAAPLIACAGADLRRARQEAQSLIERGADRLVSFGLAGGLDERLQPGALILADEVVGADDAAIPADAGWRQKVLAGAKGSGLELLGGRIVCTESVVTTRMDKAKLAQRSGAAAVDMESGPVASAAAAKGLPYLAVRAVADPASRTVPYSASRALGSDGRVRRQAYAALAVRFWEVPALFRLARDARAGLKALERAADLIYLR